MKLVGERNRLYRCITDAVTLGTRKIVCSNEGNCRNKHDERKTNTQRVVKQ